LRFSALLDQSESRPDLQVGKLNECRTASFLGAAGTVTGSKFILTAGDRRVLVDCGLFQGLKQLRLMNWQPLPVDARGIDAVVLTHAHLYHSGYAHALTLLDNDDENSCDALCARDALLDNQPNCWDRAGSNNPVGE
jgi:glyoxylase-like metal-dependent hydrolase (beta-lactamase superfamily II)